MLRHEIVCGSPYACSSELWSPRVADVLAAIDQPHNTLSIIIHGSWARETVDQASDLDLIIIQREDGRGSDRTRIVLGVSVDICSGTLEGLRRRLLAEYPSNNNFLLNALCNSRIYMDRGQCAAELVRDAVKRRDRGPLPATAEERAETRKALYRMFRAAVRLSARAGDSQEAALLAVMRCDQVVVQAMYLYQRMRNLWTDGLPHMLRRARVQDPRLYKLWEQYVNAGSRELKLAAAGTMAAAVYDDHEAMLWKDTND